MLSYCGRQKSAPKKVRALSPGTYDYVTLHNKGTFLRTSSREVILDNLGGPNLVKRAVTAQNFPQVAEGHRGGVRLRSGARGSLLGLGSGLRARIRRL